MKERRKRQRSAWSPYYCGFTDRRQPEGVVATWDRTVGGELIRTRRDLTHTARVLVAKRGPTPDEQAEPTALPFGTLTWADELAPFPARKYYDDPVAFARDILGAKLTEWQASVMRRVARGTP